MNQHATSARSSDLHTIRNHMPMLLSMVQNVDKDVPVKPLAADLFKMKGSVHLGANSLCTARLLCNIEELDEFDNDPDQYVHDSAY